MPWKMPAPACVSWAYCNRVSILQLDFHNAHASGRINLDHLCYAGTSRASRAFLQFDLYHIQG